MFPNRVGNVHQDVTIDVIGYFGTIPNITISAASAAWPTANRIFYCPFRLARPLMVKQLYVSNGTVSGNIEVGIYAPDGTRIVTSGSVLQASASALQTFDITDTLLGRGMFYLAVTLDNTTGQVSRVTPGSRMCRMVNVQIETPVSFGLPATATFGAPSDGYIPLAGLTGGTVI